MSGGNILNKRGRFITKIKYLSIYQKTNVTTKGRGRSKVVEKKTSVGIYHAKHLMEEVKGIQEAKKIAEEMVEKGIMKPSIKRKKQIA